MTKVNTQRKTIESTLRELHMPTMRECFEDIARRAEKEAMSHEAYLLELLERESEARKNKRIERLLRESCLPLEKTHEALELQRFPQRINRQYAALKDGSFLDRRENVLIFGNPGVGKSHLMCAIGHEQVKKGRRVYFASCVLLVQELLLAKRDLRLTKVLKKLSRFDALILDDIGYVQQSREEMEVLFTLLAERYEKGSVILTSNLPFSKWDRIFKDPMTAAAVIDRLVHHSVIMELNMTSYRAEKAKSRKGKEDEQEEKMIMVNREL